MDDEEEGRLVTSRALTLYYDRRQNDGNPYDLLGIPVYRRVHQRATEAARTALALEYFFHTVMLAHQETARRRGLLEEKNDTTRSAPLAMDVMDETHDDDCTICMSPIDRGDVVYDLSCKHVYHCRCLDEWMRRRRTCPMCRRKF